MAAFVARVNPDLEACYVTTAKYRSVRSTVTGKLGDKAQLAPDRIDEIAHGLAGADFVGYSSMTGYAELTRRIIARLREISPDTYQVWGGIHPIIQPEDAVRADVDAICTGEGEFAFEHLHPALLEGRDPTATKNFWFRRNGDVIRNAF